MSTAYRDPDGGIRARTTALLEENEALEAKLRKLEDDRHAIDQVRRSARIGGITELFRPVVMLLLSLTICLGFVLGTRLREKVDVLIDLCEPVPAEVP